MRGTGPWEPPLASVDASHPPCTLPDVGRTARDLAPAATQPVLGGVDIAVAGHTEVLTCGVLLAIGLLQAALDFELLLTAGSTLVVTTKDGVGLVDGTALLVVETVCPPDVEGVRRVVCFGDAPLPARAWEWASVSLVPSPPVSTLAH